MSHVRLIAQNLQPMPSPVPSHLETDGPPSRERSLLPSAFLPPFSQLDVATSTDRDSSVPPAGTDGKKKAVKPAQTSSYWRVNEMEMFPKHLHTYGKNWRKIAEEMGTKTAQQVNFVYLYRADIVRLRTIMPRMQIPWDLRRLRTTLKVDYRGHRYRLLPRQKWKDVWKRRGWRVYQYQAFYNRYLNPSHLHQNQRINKYHLHRLRQKRCQQSPVF